MPPTLTLLTRDGCHLCEEFEQELLGLIGALAVDLQTNRVEERLDWLLEYGKRIPVLLDARGRLICEGRVDPAAVEQALCAG